MKNISKKKFLYDNNIEELKELATFGALNTDFIEYIIDNSEIISWSAGELLFEAESITTEFYIIISGSITVHKNKASEPGITNHFFPGESIGFISMLCMQKWDSDVTIEKNAILMKISNPLFSSLPAINGEQFSILLINLSRNIGRAYLRRSQRYG